MSNIFYFEISIPCFIYFEWIWSINGNPIEVNWTQNTRERWCVCTATVTKLLYIHIFNWMMYILWIYWFHCILFYNIQYMMSCEWRNCIRMHSGKTNLVDKTKKKNNETSNRINFQCFCPSLILIKFSVVYWLSSTNGTNTSTLALQYWYTTLCAMVQLIELQNFRRIEIKLILVFHFGCTIFQNRQNEINFSIVVERNFYLLNIFLLLILKRILDNTNNAQKIQLYWMSIIEKNGQNKQYICILKQIELNKMKIMN